MHQWFGFWWIVDIDGDEDGDDDDGIRPFQSSAEELQRCTN